MREHPDFPPMSEGAPTRPICEDCRKRIAVDFKVPDFVWLSVFHQCDGFGYLCVQCFATRADEKMVPWCEHIELFPMSFRRQYEFQQSVLKGIVQ